MIKKTDTSKLAPATEEVLAVNKANESGVQSEPRPVPVNQPQMQERVNLVIHEWLTDMWLLTTGEEMEEFEGNKKHNGRPLAVLCDGQMKLTESKVCTLDALRAVGIEMS